MSKKQTRRSISLRAEKFVRAQALADRLGVSVSAAIEKAIDAMCLANKIPEVDRVDALRMLGDKTPREVVPIDHGAHFTF